MTMAMMMTTTTTMIDDHDDWQAALTWTNSLSELGVGTGRPSSLRLSNRVADELRYSLPSLAYRNATGKSGTCAPQVVSPRSITTM